MQGAVLHSMIIAPPDPPYPIPEVLVEMTIQEWCFWRWRVKSILFEWNITDSVGGTGVGSVTLDKTDQASIQSTGVAYSNGQVTTEETLVTANDVPTRNTLSAPGIGWVLVSGDGTDPTSTTLALMFNDYSYDPATKKVTTGVTASHASGVWFPVPSGNGVIHLQPELAFVPTLSGIDLDINGTDSVSGYFFRSLVPYYYDAFFPVTFSGTVTITPATFYEWRHPTTFDPLYNTATGNYA
jgi:hypothetical protein